MCAQENPTLPRMRLNHDQMTVLLAVTVKAIRRRQAIARARGRQFWVHPINMLREERGHIGQLYEELRQYPEKFYNFTRMPMEAFDKLVDILGPYIQRQNTRMRQAITAKDRLLITLRFLATGESFASIPSW
ncbi:uncharacterized protein [Dendropsophus ebraccatus]|uniref:uncharacterized protein isoform X2 n=1 Tax=Dendropsophus ebraccatus TaxID=150705 RepID=UPI0038313B00